MSQTKAQLVSGTTAQDLTVDNINTSSINSGQTSGRKNIVINGAMQVAQRGTSSTAGDNSFTTVDRFRVTQGGLDEDVTQEQADVAAGTTPYTLGFRKCFKITNGNQSNGAGSDDSVQLDTKLEAQDIANSGWNYLSSSSYITLSFWVKSSVAQNFFFRVQATDGTAYNYVMETGSLSADTWTKITKTIPGNSNLTFNNDNGEGLLIRWAMFRGTNQTGTRPLNAWAAYDGASRYPDNTSTWFTTNNATFELTGVQLEVGSTATDFEHKSFGEELALCQRYFQQIGASGQDGTYTIAAGYLYSHGTYMATGYVMPVMMRATPTITEGSTGLQCKSDGVNSEISSYNFIDTAFPSTHISISAQLASDAGNEDELCIWANPSNGHATLSAEL
jgi:hypothetical protein